MVREVRIDQVKIGGRHPLVVIAGPCVIESEKSTLFHAQALKKICDKTGVSLIFKSSFDKANRTSVGSFRGPGLKKGLQILSRVKKEFGLAVLSDVHATSDIEQAAEILDCLQIPAFLCRQTDLLVAAARTGKPVNVKKGQFLAPWSMGEAVKKIETCGNRSILLTERGTTFGYGNLIVDFRSLALLRELGYPVVFDATHSVQLPGAKGSSSGGERRFVLPLARAAVAFGCDALFLEVHRSPDESLCDGPNMISLKKFEELLRVARDLDREAFKQKMF